MTELTDRLATAITHRSVARGGIELESPPVVQVSLATSCASTSVKIVIEIFSGGAPKEAGRGAIGAEGQARQGVAG